LPVVSELDGSSYPELFPEDSDATGPYVALGFFSKKGLKGDFDKTLAKFKHLAEDWSRSEQKKDGQNVVWAWVDGDRWAPWSRSSYDVKMGALDGPVLLVTDPHVSAKPLPLLTLPASSQISRLVFRTEFTGRMTCRVRR
jgi:hypothetical protein